MSSYGLIVTILGFCVGGGTAAIHRLLTGNVNGSLRVRVPLETKFFLFNIFLNTHCLVKVTNIEVPDIN